MFLAVILSFVVGSGFLSPRRSVALCLLGLHPSAAPHIHSTAAAAAAAHTVKREEVHRLRKLISGICVETDSVGQRCTRENLRNPSAAAWSQHSDFDPAMFGNATHFSSDLMFVSRRSLQTFININLSNQVPLAHSTTLGSHPPSCRECPQAAATQSRQHQI